MSFSKYFFRPSAFETYHRLYGKNNTEPGWALPEMVRAIKRSPPDRGVWKARFTLVSYPLNPRNNNIGSNIMTLEGFYQGVAVDYFLRGAYVNHGVPIPIKRVIIHGVNGRNYRVFASTFALFSTWDKGEIYAPLQGGYARVEVTRNGIEIVDDNIVPLDNFTREGVIIKGENYQVVYDYYRLGVEPPNDFLGFKVQPVRGQFRNLMKRVKVLDADVVYFFAPPDFRMIRPFESRIRKLLQLDIDDLTSIIGGHGYQGYGVLADYSIIRTRISISPENILFARYGDKYVNLRPIPVPAVNKKWVVSGWTNFIALRLNPPYYVPPYATKNTIEHYLPGTVFKDIPNIEWEMM